MGVLGGGEAAGEIGPVLLGQRMASGIGEGAAMMLEQDPGRLTERIDGLVSSAGTIAGE